MIELDDRGLTLGDGLFETLLALDSRLQHAEAHLARLTAGCAQLGLPAPGADQALAAMTDALRSAGLEHGRAAVRLSWTAGRGGRGLERPPNLSPQLFATAAPAPSWSTPARLCLASVRRNEGSPASRLKSLSYLDNILARREASAAGGDEAVMLNNAGYVAGASAANLFWRDGEALCTPALDCGVLAGTTRARVLARASFEGREVREGRFTLADLVRGRGLFLTNALIGERPALLA